MYKYRVGDVEIQLSSSKPFTVYGKSLLLGNNLFVFQFDSDVQKLMEGELNGKINAITILHIPNETSPEEFCNNLKELFRYIIFHQQNEIVMHNFWVVTPNKVLIEKAKEAVLSEQRKITKNSYELFPVVDKTCFGFNLAGYTFSAGVTMEQSYFGEITGPSTEITESDLLPLDTDVKDGWYYIAVYQQDSSGGSTKSASSSEPKLIGYIRKDLIETWNIPIRGMYAVAMGITCNCIENDNQSITIRRVINPSTYDKYVAEMDTMPELEKRIIQSDSQE